MKLVLIFCIVIPLAITQRCASEHPANKKTTCESIQQNTSQVKKIVNDRERSFAEKVSSLRIMEATLKDSILYLRVNSFCYDKNNVDLVWDGSYMKSFPPHATLRLIPESSCDSANGSTEMEMLFNLSGLKYAGSGELLVNISGWSESFHFKY